LLAKLKEKLEGVKNLMIVSNLDSFIETYPDLRTELLLIFQNLCKKHGRALLNFESENEKDRTTLIVSMS